MAYRARTPLTAIRARADLALKCLLRKVRPGYGSRKEADSPDSRRELLSAFGLLPALRVSRARSFQAQENAAVGAPTSGTSPEPFGVDRFNFARLQKVNLTDPAIVELQSKMPTGKIGGVPIGRLTCGSNLIGMNMHARDLRYVRDLARHYCPTERIWMTMKMLEERGVNAFNLKASNFRQFDLLRYRSYYGGKFKWYADVIAGTDINKFEPVLVEHLKYEPFAVYLWGGSSDQWFHMKQPGNIVRAYEIMRKYRLPVGIGAHRLEPIRFCEEEGLKPDFYFLTFHHDQYWSAHARENREFNEIYDPKYRTSVDHSHYHDNMFCHDAPATAEFMKGVRVPWIAFKVMAAGAITPQDGFSYAFQNGADFLCVGMFDWQVEENVELAIKAIGAAKDRKRPWCG